MASLRVSRATNTLLSQRFFRMTALAAVGTVLSTVIGGWMRDNVIDVGFTGGDALYNFITAGVILAAPINKSTAMTMAAGAAMGGLFSALEDLGVV